MHLAIAQALLTYAVTIVLGGVALYMAISNMRAAHASVSAVTFGLIAGFLAALAGGWLLASAPSVREAFIEVAIIDVAVGLWSLASSLVALKVMR